MARREQYSSCPAQILRLHTSLALGGLFMHRRLIDANDPADLI